MKQTFLLPVLAAASFLFSGCLALENRMVYHPTPSLDLNSPTHPLIKDVYLRTTNGDKVHARWVAHPKARGAILYCHGNAGNLEDRVTQVNKLWSSLEESVLIFDYPGFGKSSGTPSERGCYAAADAAYQWLLEEKNIDPNNVLIIGQSLGGGVATDLASRRTHRALVLIRTFTSLPDVGQHIVPWLPVRWMLYNQFDNMKKIGRCSGPIFIAQADRDKLIPFSHGKKLFGAAHSPKKFHVLEGLGHNNLPTESFYRELKVFIEKVGN